MTDPTDPTAPPAPPVPIRDAATVILLRDGPDGLEAWLLTRVQQMAFAAGMSVFPGGRVEDDDGAVPLVGTSLPSVAERYGVDEAFAGALVAAAARETFEETGVLFAVPAVEIADPVTARQDVEAGRVSFAELLRGLSASVNADALHPWARWITPPGEKRRYDARFFVAALPAGAVAQDDSREALVAEWLSVATALAQLERGERMLLPPTMITLRGLAQYPTVVDVVAAAATRDLAPIEPKLRRTADGFEVELPDGTTLPVPPSMFRR
jgi:8-oxo-dGTP pyrophosphatase MutT (NUDIX family)